MEYKALRKPIFYLGCALVGLAIGYYVGCELFDWEREREQNNLEQKLNEPILPDHINMS